MSKADEPLHIRAFLVVKADGTMRVMKNLRLQIDEVAFPHSVTIPRTWGRVQKTSITVSLPEPPETRVNVGDPELSPDDEDQDE